MKIKINNKEYELNVTLGLYRKLQAKHPDTDNIQPLDYTLDAIWIYIKRRWYGLKPFVFKSRMAKAISFDEFSKADFLIAKEYHLEDREGGN